MLYILLIYSILITILFIVALYAAIKFAKYELRLEEALEDSIDKLNDAHEQISKVLKIPVAQYDPQVIFVVNTIKDTRNYIIRIASNLTNLNKEFNTESKNGPRE